MIALAAITIVEILTAVKLIIRFMSYALLRVNSIT